MKLSLSWLSDYVELQDVSPADLARRLTLAVCEVDGFESVYEHLNAVLVARVEAVERHPDADRLSICKVNAGKTTLQIVCGAPNVRAGMYAPLAPVGAKVPGKDGAGLEIKASKIRGQDSAGMLCSAVELGLEKITGEVDGLLDLEAFFQDAGAGASLKPGTPLAKLFPLTDVIFDIDNKSITHRPDLWCHWGFAREIAAIYSRKLKYDPLAKSKYASAPSSATAAKKKTAAGKKAAAPSIAAGSFSAPVLAAKKIHIAPGAAKAYYALPVTGVQVKPAPLWMQARLLNIGQRPINNIVDATNYAMFELGQPNHAFDAASLKHDSIHVALTGKAAPLKEFRTLDGETRQLPEETIVIFDGKPGVGSPVALGGIMGGENSGVLPATTSLVLESATFPRERIRRTIAAIGLRTDSAQRFEKGQDPAKAEATLYRLCELLAYTCPELTRGPLCGDMPEKPRRNQIKVGLEFLQKRLGFAVSAKQVVDTLQRLHFTVKTTGAPRAVQFVVTAPTWRSQYDITRPEDIVEELGRVHGYDHIAPAAPLAPVEAAPPNRERELERLFKRTAASAGGFTETYNYSFAGADDNLLFGRKGLALKNPVFTDRPELRIALLPGLLRQAAANQDRFTDVRLFEFGRIYLKDARDRLKPDLPREEKHFSFVWAPEALDAHDTAPDEQTLFARWLEFRAFLEGLLAECGAPADLQRVERPQDAAPYLHPGAAIEFRSRAGAHLGYAGILHPLFQERYDLRRRALVADFAFPEILQTYETTRLAANYGPPSIYPDSTFELSLLLDEAEGTEKPIEIIRSMHNNELTSVRLLTLYRGQPLPSGKKSASYELRAGRADRTLSGDELQSLLNAIVAELAKAGFPLR